MKKYLIYLSTILLTILAGCSNITVLDTKSTTGQEQGALIWYSLAIMAIVLIVVFSLFFRFVIKYRYTKEKKDFIPKDVEGNLALELTWTIIPIILLAILAIPTVKTTLDHSPKAEEDADLDGVHVYVTAEQFTWRFEHETGRTAQDHLVIPEGEKITFHLESNDVIHSFWIPELAGKVDVMPHKVITYKIKNAEIGEYAGKCAEYCGAQHTNMVFDVKVVSEEDYEEYVEEVEN